MHINDTLRQKLVLRIDTFLAWLRRWQHFYILSETVRLNVQVFREFLSNLKKALISPITEPINNTTIE
jgi:hypothetical protein